ncbi:MAG: bifunctional adenosylcobinamide hydrolase/alpha-ribazole phosphatase CbiS [Thermoprotei archaeon]
MNNTQNVKIYFKDNTLIIESASEMEVLSSAVFNGGRRKAQYIINHRVSKTFDDPKPALYLKNVIEKLGLPHDSTIGLMTAADVHNASIINEGPVTAIITAGLSNTATAGDDIAVQNIGTINMIIIVNGLLNENAFVDAIITATEAKTVALDQLDIISRVSRKRATGTTTDSIVIACTQQGERYEYAGTATKIGNMIAKSVIKGVLEAIKLQENITSSRPILKRLEERGITLKDLVETGMELYIHHPSMGTIENARKTLEEILIESMNDINVASLIIAGIRIEEEGRKGLIPGLTREEFEKDPVNLVADELIGMAIADYIAGSRGIFEYVRFDRIKPGIIRNLGPFMDDIIGALIGGASSLMYTKLLKKQK